ncbi:MAG: peptide ABC transporter permease, partial [Dongiaceae bacterium]
MLRYIVGRLIQMIPVLIGVSLISFFAIQFVPGDPIQIMLLGRASPETVAAMHAEYGLDLPVWQQYLNFIAGALQGDLGRSIVQKTSVTSLVADGLGVSLFLLAYGALLSVLIGVSLISFFAIQFVP